VQSGIFGPEARVARGSAIGVIGQHSWLVVGDPYDEDAPIVDVTLWSYDDNQPKIWRGTLRDGVHRPQGSGSIWLIGGPPPDPEGEIIELQPPEDGWSFGAISWLDMIGPLDLRGWHHLFNGPVEGWPAREIITQAASDKRLKALIPIDILGMVTDLDPSGLYLGGSTE